MPLERGTGPATIAHNIAEMVRAGHPQKQAVAAAMREARGDMDCDRLDTMLSACDALTRRFDALVEWRCASRFDVSWEESAHPRGEDGKFSASSGGVRAGSDYHESERTKYAAETKPESANLARAHQSVAVEYRYALRKFENGDLRAATQAYERAIKKT